MFEQMIDTNMHACLPKLTIMGGRGWGTLKAGDNERGGVKKLCKLVLMRGKGLGNFVS